jgi:hypothetical protein
MLNEIGLVPSEAPPDGLSGADYQRVDNDNVLAGNAYWYVLVEVESVEGAENRTQPIRVAVADEQPTNTPTRTPTPTSTATLATPGSPSATPTATPTGTPVLAGSTATPAIVRTLSNRATAPPEPGEVTRSAFEAGQNDDNSLVASAQGQATPTPPPENTAEPPAESQAIAAQSDPDGYPGPQTPQILATKSYPAPAGPRDLTNGDGTPLPNIGANSRAPAEGQSEQSQTPTNSPALGTLFLWLGFTAALVVFISALAGAIYYYNRQRSGSP